LHGEETVVYADAAYQGADQRFDAKASVHWQVAMRPGKRKKLDKANIPFSALMDKIEKCKASIRADGGGDLTNALIGEIMVGDAIKQGLGGYLINGAIRDADALKKGSFPVFAAGVTHREPYKDGPVEINVPIAIDGIVIEPGDLIIGDDHGLLCVPFDDVVQLLAAAHQKQVIEIKMIADIQAGTFDRSWFDATLTRLNCFIEQ
jgi:regulator of RNase E activity RraA